MPLLPSITLPKGGGAIRGIGEKFAANPVTGTGSLTIPIYTSPGRSGFGPNLSLSYDSGAGNGPFGFGWSLALPAITRKTDKGLPQYADAGESDVFILSGAEDLMPALVQAKGEWIRDITPARTVYTKRYADSSLPASRGKLVCADRAVDQSGRSAGYLLAIHLSQQYHHLVRQDRGEPHCGPRRSEPHLSLADLRKL